MGRLLRDENERNAKLLSDEHKRNLAIILNNQPLNAILHPKQTIKFIKSNHPESR